MEKNLKENERIDDLEYKGLKIIQNKNWFCFGMDSIILANFAKEENKGSKILDLGTGTGIIAILLSKKIEKSRITAIEIQKDVAEMAQRSIKLNDLEESIEIINEDIKKIGQAKYDIVITNPPYKKKNTGLINNNEKQFISRHETTATLQDFIKISYKMLKDKGDLYIVHRPDRLVDLIEILRQNKLEPKKIKFVYPNIEKEPNIVLVKATKNAKPFLKIEKPLYIYNKDGKYTKEILKIYGKSCN